MEHMLGAQHYLKIIWVVNQVNCLSLRHYFGADTESPPQLSSRDQWHAWLSRSPSEFCTEMTKGTLKAKKVHCHHWGDREAGRQS